MSGTGVPEPGRGISVWRIPVVAAGCALTLLAVLVVALRRAAPPPAPDVGQAATVLPVPAGVPDFSLRDQAAAPFDRSRLVGRWSFLFFGYTYCPTICPVTLTVLHQARDLLKPDAGLLRDTQFVFVSVDPERDTLERLARYTTYFDPSFLGVTGDPGELSRLAGSVGVYYRKGEPAAGEQYEIDHSQAVLLFDPQARLHAVFGHPTDPQAIAEAYGRIREGAAQSGVQVEEAWIAEPPPGAVAAAGFLRLVNPDATPHALVGARSSACERVELHRSVVENGIARMIRLDRVVIPPDGSIRFAPGGRHLMLIHPSSLRAGGEAWIELEFEDGDTVGVQAEVRKLSAPPPKP